MKGLPAIGERHLSPADVWQFSFGASSWIKVAQSPTEVGPAKCPTAVTATGNEGAGAAAIWSSQRSTVAEISSAKGRAASSGAAALAARIPEPKTVSQRSNSARKGEAWLMASTEGVPQVVGFQFRTGQRLAQHGAGVQEFAVLLGEPKLQLAEVDPKVARLIQDYPRRYSLTGLRDRPIHFADLKPIAALIGRPDEILVNAVFWTSWQLLAHSSLTIRAPLGCETFCQTRPETDEIAPCRIDPER